MKVEFYFTNDPIIERPLVNKSIKEKVHGTLIDLPFVPTKGMRVDIASFAEVFGFTEEELDWLTYNSGWPFIYYIVVKVARGKIWLE